MKFYIDAVYNETKGLFKKAFDPAFQEMLGNRGNPSIIPHVRILPFNNISLLIDGEWLTF